MPKVVTALELPLQPKAPGATLADWLSAEIVAAIRDGRLQPGTRLPATRDLAQQDGVARGTVIAVFERLRAEGRDQGRRGYAGGERGGGRANDPRCATVAADARQRPAPRSALSSV